MKSERVVIASLLDTPNGELPPHLNRILHHAPESFDDAALGELAVTVRKLRNEGRPVTPVAVAETCGLPDAETLLIGLVPDTLSVDLAEAEAQSVWQAYQSRQATKILAEALKGIEQHPRQQPNIIAHVLASFADLVDSKADGLTIRTANEILGMAFDENDRILGDRLLSKGGSLVISGPGGIGKSRLLLQLAVACRAGLPWLGFETRGQGLRWLVLQAENSNRRLQADLAALRAWIGDRVWPQVSAGLFLHTLETDVDGFLSLDNEETQGRIRAAIKKYKPDVVCYDSLYNFSAGDLNSDEAMASTLLSISRLSKAGDPQRAIVLLHHSLTGKAGAARAVGFDRSSYGRNSKLLHQWTRAQINLAPGAADDNNRLVMSCGKLNDGQAFAPFAVQLDPATMVYSVDPDFDLAAWQAEISDRKQPLLTVDRIGELCQGSMSKKELARAIMDDTGCVKQYAYRMVQKAERAKVIQFSKISEAYVRKS